MEAPSIEQIAQRLWSEHKYAIHARSKEAATEIAGAVASGGEEPARVVDAIEAAMRLPEAHLAEALDDAWHHLLPRVGTPSRAVEENLRKRNVEHVRWFVGMLAERVGDAVVASSRLFDHPEAARRLWLRDAHGPTMYLVHGDHAVRIAPADVARLLTDAFGDTALRALHLLAERPHTAGEIEAAVGPLGPKVLEAAHRLLVIRRVAGLYRSRGEALRVVLAGLGG